MVFHDSSAAEDVHSDAISGSLKLLQCLTVTHNLYKGLATTYSVCNGAQARPILWLAAPQAKKDLFYLLCDHHCNLQRIFELTVGRNYFEIVVLF